MIAKHTAELAIISAVPASIIRRERRSGATMATVESAAATPSVSGMNQGASASAVYAGIGVLNSANARAITARDRR